MSTLENVKTDFRSWLVDERGYSNKYASDVISRCRHIERLFEIDISETCQSKEGYLSLMRQLGDYCQKSSPDRFKGYRKTAMYRLSVRKFLDFKTPLKAAKYPKYRY